MSSMPLWPTASAAALVCAATLSAEPVPVRHTEGIVHGFLALRTLDGATIANGDLIQRAAGTQVTSRLVFRFKDGSLHDETAVYSQRGTFRLLSDHLVQKGPAFPRPLDMTIGRDGNVLVRYSDEGKEKVEREHLELPPDLANGMILTLLKNVRPDAPPKTLSYVAATPKPRLVKLEISTTRTPASGRVGSGTGSVTRSS